MDIGRVDCPGDMSRGGGYVLESSETPTVKIDVM